MRILCLHGFGQNARVFRSKTAALRKALGRDAAAELVFVDAPFLVELQSGGTTGLFEQGTQPEDTARRTWWNASKDGVVYGGWQETVRYLAAIFREQGPFEGLLGFSQGASLSHLICAIAAGRGKSLVALPHEDAPGEQHSPPDSQTWVPSETAFASLRFAILISGFPSRSPAHAALMAFTGADEPLGGRDPSALAPLALPSLHVWGNADSLVPPSASSLLAKQFGESTRQAVVHDGGHFVPCNAEMRRVIALFIGRLGRDKLVDNRQAAEGADRDIK